MVAPKEAFRRRPEQSTKGRPVAPDHPDAFLAAIDEELARRSCEDTIVVFEDLPPIKPSEITQILREIDGKTKGTPSAPSYEASP
jgi:hypothetical protein